jgi:hypothetical protein
MAGMRERRVGARSIPDDALSHIISPQEVTGVSMPHESALSPAPHDTAFNRTYGAEGNHSICVVKGIATGTAHGIPQSNSALSRPTLDISLFDCVIPCPVCPLQQSMFIQEIAI